MIDGVYYANIWHEPRGPMLSGHVADPIAGGGVGGGERGGPEDEGRGVEGAVRPRNEQLGGARHPT
eukprot:4333058-Pyramimonas_sp.AAC.1